MDGSSITIDGLTITGTAEDMLTLHIVVANAIEKLGLELSNEFLWFPYVSSHMGLETGVARSVQLVRLRADSSVSVSIIEDSTSSTWFDRFHDVTAKGHSDFVRTYGSGGSTTTH